MYREGCILLQTCSFVVFFFRERWESSSAAPFVQPDTLPVLPSSTSFGDRVYSPISPATSTEATRISQQMARVRPSPRQTRYHPYEIHPNLLAPPPPPPPPQTDFGDRFFHPISPATSTDAPLRIIYEPCVHKYIVEPSGQHRTLVQRTFLYDAQPPRTLVYDAPTPVQRTVLYDTPTQVQRVVYDPTSQVYQTFQNDPAQMQTRGATAPIQRTPTQFTTVTAIRRQSYQTALPPQSQPQPEQGRGSSSSAFYRPASVVAHRAVVGTAASQEPSYFSVPPPSNISVAPMSNISSLSFLDDITY